MHHVDLKTLRLSSMNQANGVKANMDHRHDNTAVIFYIINKAIHWILNETTIWYVNNKWVYSFKYLGLKLNESLFSHNHISNMESKYIEAIMRYTCIDVKLFEISPLKSIVNLTVSSVVSCRSLEVCFPMTQLIETPIPVSKFTYLWYVNLLCTFD